MSQIIAMLAAAILSITPTVMYFQNLQDSHRQAVINITAQQFQLLLAGIHRYVRAHATPLEDGLSTGQMVPVTLDALLAEHDLPPGFTAINPFGQQWQIYVAQPVTGTLEAWITATGGETLSPKDVVSVATHTGAQGGYIPQDGLIAGLTSQVAQGAAGTWSRSIPGAINPGPGHLFGVVASANDVDNNADYLYRETVPGHPELNTMHAALNMAGNDIKNAHDANFTGRIGVGGTRAADGPYPGVWYGGVHTFDSYVDGGTYGAGTNGTLNVAISGQGASGFGWASQFWTAPVFRPTLVAVSGQPCGTADNDTTSWATTHWAGTTTDSGSFAIENGDIAKDENGATLVCRKGIWSPAVAGAHVTNYMLDPTPGDPSGDTHAASLGEHVFCALTDSFEYNKEDPTYGFTPNATRVLPVGIGPHGFFIWNLSRGDHGTFGGGAACIDFDNTAATTVSNATISGSN